MSFGGSGGTTDVTPPDLKRRLDHGEDLIVLDVREDDERALASIPVPPSARDLHIPLTQLTRRVGEVDEAAGGRRVVVYCHQGFRSGVAARLLADRGVNAVENLVGGIDAWSSLVDPAVPRY